MAKLEMAKILYLKWENALVKWELVGGKKELEGMPVANVEFPKVISSMMERLEIATNSI